MSRIFGYEWADIQAMQQRKYESPGIKARGSADYGSDPLPDGKFRMVPSGDVVDLAERNRRLPA